MRNVELKEGNQREQQVVQIRMRTILCSIRDHSKFESFFVLLVPLITTFIFYSCTCSQKLTWANHGNDGGDFLAAILTGGIPHPTGYPTYVLLGRLFQFLPVGDEYFRGVLLSFLPAAAASGLLALWVNNVLVTREKYIRVISSLLGGIGWGLSPLLWSQAVIVEVHGLQSLFLVCSLWLVTENLRANRHPGLILFLSWVFGLGLGNHITLVFMFPVVLYGLFVSYKNNKKLVFIFSQLGLILLGLAIYLYIPIQARSYPPINWGNPTSIDGFFWLVSGKAYQGLLFGITPALFFDRLAAFFSMLREQFGIPGVIAGIVGLLNYQLNHKGIKASLIWIFVIYTLFSFVYSTDDSTGYLLASFMVFAIWISFGVNILFEMKLKLPIINFLVVFLVIVSFIIKIPGTFSDVTPAGRYAAAEYAENLLEKIPQNAILLTDSDPDSFPVWYYHFGLKGRQDISVIVLPLTQFRWYQVTLLHVYPELSFPALINDFANNSIGWGEELAVINGQERIICRNKTGENKIVTGCSDGTSIESAFPNMDL